MTTTYDFDVTSHAFKHFYQNQTGTGGSIPVFRGLTRQRGYGIGGIFSKMFQSIAPVLKNVARSAGKQLVKTGANFITDVIDGNNSKKICNLKLITWWSAINILSHIEAKNTKKRWS